MKNLKLFEDFNESHRYNTRDFTFSGVPTDSELIDTFMSMIDDDIIVRLKRDLDFAVALKGPSRTIRPVKESWEYTINTDGVLNITSHNHTDIDEESKLVGFVDKFQIYCESPQEIDILLGKEVDDIALDDSIVNNAMRKLKSLECVTSVTHKKVTEYYSVLIVQYNNPTFIII